MDFQIYGPVVAGLLEGVPPAPLDMGRPNEKSRAALTTLTPEKLFSHAHKKVRDEQMAQCCLAGLWLRHGFFDESHRFSQEIETPSGSFWHAILHRREPDYGNARYWFRRVGSHPIFPALNDAAISAGWPASPRWEPYSFIEKVEQVSQSTADKVSTQLCLAVQQIEWELLFDFCWQHTLS